MTLSVILRIVYSCEKGYSATVLIFCAYFVPSGFVAGYCHCGRLTKARCVENAGTQTVILGVLSYRRTQQSAKWRMLKKPISTALIPTGNKSVWRIGTLSKRKCETPR